MLSRDFLVLFALAFAIAAPITWIGLTSRLGGFAYRIDIGPGIFAVAALLTLSVALATVSTQAVRAALADPVKALRSE